MINKLDGAFVVPGEKLGVVEEFDPGRGTVEVGGVVYSSQTGVASVDPKRRVVSVKTNTGPVVVPEEGSTIIGIVEKVQEKMAIINMIVVDGKKMVLDRKSTRLNSSHSQISYAVFCLKKKTNSLSTPRALHYTD